MEDKHYLVPKQKEGIEKNFAHTVTARTVADAEDWFVDAKNRLLDINHWKQSSEHLSAEFRLTDSHGKPVSRHAHKGDYIRIDLPGPGPVTGDGFDWVLVEAIEYDDYPDEHRETFAIRVRPADNPTVKKNDTAHFFSSDATSTFVIERKGKQISALYHGRNEVPNMDVNMIDKARNAAVALGAWLGMSDVQWTGLIKGLLES
ncbi:MAG: hypothetical protein V4649_06995 [Bacteroidota bacterium]